MVGEAKTPPTAAWTVALAVHGYLDHGIDRFRLATLLRLRLQQAAALVSPSYNYHHARGLALDLASRDNNLELLDLVRRHAPPGTDFSHCYSSSAAWHASANGHVAVLQWWLDSGLPPMHAAQSCLVAASELDRVEVLDWWLRNGLLTQAEIARAATDGVDAATMRGAVAALHWWRTVPGAPVQDDPYAVDRASTAGHVAVLAWWRDADGGALLRRAGYSERAVDGASAAGHVAVLRWWADESGLPMRYSELALAGATAKGHVDVLQWWRDSGLEMRFRVEDLHLDDDDADKDAGGEGGGNADAAEADSGQLEARAAARRWWRESGLT
ncbi:hypothetical protein DFJ73DRAFT_624573 [Zopfochytrium polystomum]|nr:hypothetical protein DFJ73DRAFT_624573 [Zopfochytrium polystomum]